MLRQLLAEQTVDDRVGALARPMSAAALERRHTHRTADKADQRRAEDDDWERHAEKEDADEGSRRERDAGPGS